jgi:transposase-like protein
VICGPDEDFPDFSAVNLRWIFSQTTEELLRFLAHNGLLQNERNCESCDGAMSIIKKPGTSDQVEWNCSDCRIKKSVRADSFFSGSNLPLTKAVPLLYMWFRDFRNMNAVHEAEVNKATVVDWFSKCRNECMKGRKVKIGGVGKIVEIDETCWVKQKHNRGKPKKGSQVWFFGGIERGQDGQAFAVRVKDRKQATLFKIIKRYIRPDTLIISDEWRAYLKLEKHVPQYTHMLIRHKKKNWRWIFKEGDFSRWNRNECQYKQM